MYIVLIPTCSSYLVHFAPADTHMTTALAGAAKVVWKQCFVRGRLQYAKYLAESGELALDGKTGKAWIRSSNDPKGGILAALVEKDSVCSTKEASLAAPKSKPPPVEATPIPSGMMRCKSGFCGIVKRDHNCPFDLVTRAPGSGAGAGSSAKPTVVPVSDGFTVFSVDGTGKTTTLASGSVAKEVKKPPSGVKGNDKPSSKIGKKTNDQHKADAEALFQNLMKQYEIIIATDGACEGNPGPCGAGAVMTLPGLYLDRKQWIERYAALGNGTNNIGELTGIELALDLLDDIEVGRISLPKECKLTKDEIKLYGVSILTDSTYARGMFCLGWKAKANEQLIERIKARLAKRKGRLDIHWVKGHAGFPANEWADKLACKGAREARGGRGGTRSPLDPPRSKGESKKEVMNEEDDSGEEDKTVSKSSSKKRKRQESSSDDESSDSGSDEPSSKRHKSRN